MAAAKYLKVGTDGLPTEQAGATTATANAIIAGDGNGRINADQMPVGVVAATKTLKAKEVIVAGDYINTVLDTTMKAQKADNSNGRFAEGFALAGGQIGDDILIYLEGMNTSVTGKTVGKKYFLGASGGVVDEDSLPTGAGVLLQYLGKCYAATEIGPFEQGNIIVLAA